MISSAWQWIGRAANSNAAIAVLLVLAVAERVAWNVIRPGVGASGEALHVATALAGGRGFADAYQVGQGATAHLLPISPAIAGAIYALFGVQSMPAEIILAAWSIGLAMGSYLLLFRAFGRLGLSRVTRLGALAFLCFAPAYIAQEAVDFRIWEGGLSVFLTALFLDRMLALEHPTGRAIAGMALLNALLFFVNPIGGIAAYLCAILFCVRRLSVPRLFGAGLAAAAALALFILPWALRNQAALGEPVLLRSNSGLELALANYDGAVDPPDRREAFIARLGEIHPAQSRAAFAAMQASGGEVPYARALGDSAKSWMRAHPIETLRLTARHFRQALFPEPWVFVVFGSGRFGELRAAIASLAGLFGLCGLGWALVARRPNWIYPAILILVPACLMCLFQPVPRYTYLLYAMLVYAGAAFCAAMLSRMSRRSDIVAAPEGA